MSFFSQIAVIMRVEILSMVLFSALPALSHAEKWIDYGAPTNTQHVQVDSDSVDRNKYPIPFHHRLVQVGAGRNVTALLATSLAYCDRNVIENTRMLLIRNDQPARDLGVSARPPSERFTHYPVRNDLLHYVCEN